MRQLNFLDKLDNKKERAPYIRLLIEENGDVRTYRLQFYCIGCESYHNMKTFYAYGDKPELPSKILYHFNTVLDKVNQDDSLDDDTKTTTMEKYIKYFYKKYGQYFSESSW